MGGYRNIGRLSHLWYHRAINFGCEGTMAKAGAAHRPRAPRDVSRIAGETAIVAPNVRPVTPAAEIEALTGDPNFMTSLARGLAVIRAFTQQRRHLSIAQLSQ